jgi:vacuolar-type H+-ATPase subunit H
MQAQIQEGEKIENPEERFRELVAIREKEQEIEAKIEAARAEADQLLEEVDRQIQQMRAEVERAAREEVERMRSQALREADEETQKLLAQAESEAQEIERKAGERIEELIPQLAKELLMT